MSGASSSRASAGIMVPSGVAIRAGEIVSTRVGALQRAIRPLSGKLPRKKSSLVRISNRPQTTTAGMSQNHRSSVMVAEAARVKLVMRDRSDCMLVCFMFCNILLDWLEGLGYTKPGTTYILH